MVNKIIKIVHLITTLNIGGAESMLVKIATNMNKEKYKNIIICILPEGTMAEKLKECGIKVYSLNMRHKYTDVFILIKVIKLFKEIKPDILHTWLYHADLLGLIAGKIVGVKKIIWNIRCSNVDMTHYSFMSSLVLWILVKLSALPDLVMTNSHSGLNAHKELGYRPKKWMVVQNGIDVDLYKPDVDAKNHLCALLGVPSNLILVGLIARFDPMKDHALFLEAASKLENNIDSIRYILIGSDIDNHNNTILNLVKKYNLSNNISLMGEQPEIWKLLPGLDVVTLTSAYGEGFPNVIGEAMSCGIPCVATDVGDVSTIIGDTGIVTQPRNVAEMTNALETMVNMQAEKRLKLGGKARERILKNYLLADIIKKYENIYSGLMI